LLTLAVPALLAISAADTAFAAARPTFATCEALSIQRGVGPEGPGTGAHRRFMNDCLAGRIQETAGTQTQRQAGQAQSYDRCEALSEQRGAGVNQPGAGTHQRFMTACMAGRIR